MTLKNHCYLKRLEEPHIYDAAADELYLLDDESLERILALSEGADDPEAAGLLAEAGLLQEMPRKVPVQVPGRSADPSLRYLEVQITGRCDKACRHCYLGPPRPVDMSVGTFRSVLDQFAVMQGLKVMVSGGEAAVHPEFEALADLLPEAPFRAVLITHGEWIGPVEACRLGERFHQVQVSLDGMGEGHDALRGAGSFDRAVAGIMALREAGVPVAVGTMVHDGNLEQFEAMSRLLERFNVEEWSIDVPCPAGRWHDHPAAGAALRTASEKLRFAYGGGFHGGSAGLACGSALMTVAPDGTAAKCGFYFDHPAGNVLVDGLAEVWSKVEHIPLGTLACDCELKDVCAGGCRYRAEVLGGSKLAPDAVQCYFRGVK
ncbi:MAG: radical SAM protein [bacterium]|nr:radical SAM protein [bacterium]